MNNPVNWFEIATTDLERAKAFYGQVFETEFNLIEMPDSKMYMFAGGPDLKGAVGALIHSAQSKPSAEGTVVYFGVEDCAVEAGRVADAGGQLLFPKTDIGQFGFIAQFVDTEGNRIGLHSHA